MSTGTSVVVVGSANTDLVVRAPRIPRPGETVLGGAFLCAQGGKGANQAVAAARLGAEVTLIARIGRDEYGARTLERLTAEGIDVRFVARDDAAPSGVALIVVADGGENAIAVAPGANARLAAGDVDRAGEHLDGADVVLLQLEVPASTVLHAARRAAARGVPVILNPAPAAGFDPALLSAVDVLTPNETEASILSGVAVDGERTAVRAAERLRELGAPAVVLTMGAAGALVVSERGSERVEAPRIRPVDSTAAGDAFNAALAIGLARGEPLGDATRFACAVGALTATRAGAQPSLPTRADVDRFLRRDGDS